MGGSASRTISDSNMPDPGGGHRLAWKRPKDDTHGPRWTPDVQGFPVLWSLTPAEKDRRDRAVQNRAAVVYKDSKLDPLCHPEWDGSHRAPLGRCVRAPRRRMRPAGDGGSARWVTPAGGNDAMKRAAVRPLLVEAVEFSPALAPEQNVRSGRKTMSSGTGGIIPTVVVDSGGGGGGGGMGVTFTAVAEVHMSAPVDEEEKLIAQVNGQHVVCNTDPGKAPAILSAPLGDTLVSKPKMHSAQKIVLDGIGGIGGSVPGTVNGFGSGSTSGK